MFCVYSYFLSSFWPTMYATVTFTYCVKMDNNIIIKFSSPSYEKSLTIRSSHKTSLRHAAMAKFHLFRCKPAHLLITGQNCPVHVPCHQLILCLVSSTAPSPSHSNWHNKSAIFLAGNTRSQMLMFAIYFHSGDRLSRENVLVTPAQCNGNYITCTRSLAICYL